MPTTLSKQSICNQALALIGVKPINDIDAQDDIPAEQCRVNWDLAFSALGREHAWNCLLTPVALVAEAQTPIVSPEPVPASTNWAQSTAYAVGDYVTFGEPQYIYQCLIAHTSTASFTNDLTAGYWFQTDILDPDPFAENPGENYASGWAYKYPLPEDCLLVVEINNVPAGGPETEFEIMGSALYTNNDTAIIKYVKADPDTTRYDSLFVACLVYGLASRLATVLRQDDTNISVTMKQLYNRELNGARQKDSSERKPRRFDAVANSNWVGSRYRSTNS